jgi:hypothetical protein
MFIEFIFNTSFNSISANFSTFWGSSSASSIKFDPDSVVSFSPSLSAEELSVVCSSDPSSVSVVCFSFNFSLSLLGSGASSFESLDNSSFSSPFAGASSDALGSSDFSISSFFSSFGVSGLSFVSSPSGAATSSDVLSSFSGVSSDFSTVFSSSTCGSSLVGSLALMLLYAHKNVILLWFCF